MLCLFVSCWESPLPLDTISFTDTGTDRALIVRRGLSSGSLAAAQLSPFLSKCSWQWRQGSHMFNTSGSWCNLAQSESARLMPCSTCSEIRCNCWMYDFGLAIKYWPSWQQSPGWFPSCWLRMWTRLTRGLRLLPIAAIATPGTLNVVAAHNRPVTELQVPQINFANSSSFSYPDESGYFQSSSDDLFRLAVTVASGASLLQIPSTFPNASYQLEFFAPAISCQKPNASVAGEIESYINATWIENSRLDYLAFVPRFMNISENLNFTCGPNGQPSEAFPTIDFASLDTARLYVTLAFEISDGYVTPLVECLLKNASYKVGFDFSYPDQNLTVTQRELLHGVSAEGLEWNSQNERWAYAGVMDVFGRILCGLQSISSGGSTSAYTLYSITELNTISSNYLTSEPDQFVPTLEGIFQNITLSLFSNAIFR